MISFQQLIANADKLGVHPEAMQTLMSVMDDPLVDAETLLPLVEKDMGLTASLLAICNSPIYGLRREIGSVRDALVILGNYAFARIAFVISVEKMLLRDQSTYGLSTGEIRNHSLAVAYGASRLAKSMGYEGDQLHAFTAGMLHDCGKILLDPLLADMFDWKYAERPARIDGVFERSVTGYDHGKAGAGLLSFWGLPQSVVQAIRCHHDPESAGNYCTLAGLLWAADAIVHLNDDGAEFAPEDETSPFAVFLDHGLPAEVIRDLIDCLPENEQDLMPMAARG